MIKIPNREELIERFREELQFDLEDAAHKMFDQVEQFFNAEIEKKDKAIAELFTEIDGLRTEIEMLKNPWIKCSEALPERLEEIILQINGKYYIGELRYHDKVDCYYLYVPAYSDAEYLRIFFMDDKENLEIKWQRIVPPEGINE